MGNGENNKKNMKINEKHKVEIAKILNLKSKEGSFITLTYPQENYPKN